MDHKIVVTAFDSLASSHHEFVNCDNLLVPSKSVLVAVFPGVAYFHSYPRIFADFQIVVRHLRIYWNLCFAVTLMHANVRTKMNAFTTVD